MALLLDVLILLQTLLVLVMPVARYGTGLLRLVDSAHQDGSLEPTDDVLKYLIFANQIAQLLEPASVATWVMIW
jgi:hypothetical protein